MVVYNVTISIDVAVADNWLEWMKETHIPDVMATGCFRDSKICRVQGEEEGGMTFAIMYTAHTAEDMDDYQTKHAPKLQLEHTERFKGKFASFRTLLSVVQEFK